MCEKQSSHASLPVSRGSAVDSELADLMHQFPRETTEFLNDLYMADHSRYKGQQKQGKQLLVAARSTQQNRTKYQDDYPAKAVRPRSNKRPPPTPRDPNPPAMTFDTWQRSVYVPKEVVGARPLPFKPADNSAEHHQSLEGQDGVATTSYRANYTPKALEPLRGPVNAAVADRDRRKAAFGAKFYDTTTSGEHYQRWQPQAKLHFGELPSFTQSILYPNAQREMQSEVMEVYKGSKGLPAQLIKCGEPTLRLEGQHDFQTTHKETYVKQEGQSLTKPIRVRPQLLVDKRQPLVAVTQARSDFPGFKGGQPRPPLPVEPLQPTIDLKFDANRYLDTEQRAIYKGHDILKHPVPDAFVPDDRKYEPPSEKFATTTVTKSDYVPIQLDASLQQVQAKMPRTRHSHGAKFYDQTTTKEFFQDWTPQIKPRLRYGDFHEAYKAHIPAIHKLKGLTETQESFVPKRAEAVVSFKPEPVPIDQGGDQLFDTEYRAVYRGKKFALSRHQAAELKRRLRQLRSGCGVPLRRRQQPAMASA